MCTIFRLGFCSKVCSSKLAWSVASINLLLHLFFEKLVTSFSTMLQLDTQLFLLSCFCWSPLGLHEIERSRKGPRFLFLRQASSVGDWYSLEHCPKLRPRHTWSSSCPSMVRQGWYWWCSKNQEILGFLITDGVCNNSSSVLSLTGFV